MYAVVQRVRSQNQSNRSTLLSLNSLNRYAALAHGLLACFTIGMMVYKDPPFMLKFKKAWAPGGSLPLPQSPLSNSTCNGTDYTDPNGDGDISDSSVFDWFDCVREVYQAEEQARCEACQNETSAACARYNATNCGRLFDLRKDDRYNTRDTDMQTNSTGTADGDLPDIPVAWLLLVFEVVTAAAHYAIAGPWVDLYNRLLEAQLQPFRWLEYSFTASIMLWCALSLSRVQDQFLLLSLFLNSFYLNFVGGGLFEVCGWASRQNEQFPQLFQRLQWLCFTSAWFAYAIVIWTSLDAMDAIITPYINNPNTGVLWAELFDVVVWVNVGILVTYTAFPLIHLWVFCPCRHDRLKAPERYMRGEKMYIYASFIAKTTLVVTIGVAAFLRED
jgi:hypothetical protein